jgi:hypothetical protein
VARRSWKPISSAMSVNETLGAFSASATPDAGPRQASSPTTARLLRQCQTPARAHLLGKLDILDLHVKPGVTR